MEWNMTHMIRSIMIAFFVLLFLPVSSIAQNFTVDAPTNNHTVYLPVLVGSGTISSPATERARFWLPFQTADNRNVTLYGPSVAVDGKGGIHVAYLTVLGPFSTYDFAITSTGDPRIILYTGDPTTNQTLRNNQLYYLWCQTACTDRDNANWGLNWQSYALGTHSYFGMTVSFLLDAADRPHLAYQMGDEGGPGYTRCTANCESEAGAAGWQRAVVVDTSAELNQDWPVIPWYNCSISTWVSGRRPWLALDPRTGAPRISYEAHHYYAGVDLDHPGYSCPVIGDIFLARLALLTP
jgi:hypothetical protein